MGFYYISIFSIFPLGFAYGLLAPVFWGAVIATRGLRRRGALLSGVAVVFLALPMSEELWIAWNFGQACKESGTFIYRKVQADGFYDSTMRTGYQYTKSGRYRFVEHAAEDQKGIERVELASNAEREKALAWFGENNPGKERPKDRFILYSVGNGASIAVLPNGIDAWKVTKLDRPTARYHFRNTDPMNGTPWGHKIGRSGSVVIDAETNEEIARYTSFGRRPPWFYFSVGIAPYACDSPGNWPNPSGNPLVYREALIPADRR